MDITTTEQSNNSIQPKGILKNSSQITNSSGGINKGGLIWDESNLTLNELQKDSTMK